ncbi:MAG TPA: energy transducer TonB [Pyrinomonadaceae bacterium]|nr:energy transducer TonB [Pyrinomonadaceae bacterium]
MFNNLIESSSHAQEYKRRGSFLLFTSATYVVLFAVAAVASIYAYDARLEKQTTELDVLIWVPPPPPETAPEVVRNTIRPAANNTTTPARSTRTVLIDSTLNPNNPPRGIGTIASNIPPALPYSEIGTINADPPAPAGSVRGTPGGTGAAPVVDLPDPPPAPPAPAPAVPKVLKVSRVLNSQAISLPPPNYPSMARQIRLTGTVIVQVLIDEKGNVVSAKATSGHPLLVPEAQKAALRARFSPTVLGDQPVKVSGVITYNFVLGK